MHKDFKKAKWKIIHGPFLLFCTMLIGMKWIREWKRWKLQAHTFMDSSMEWRHVESSDGRISSGKKLGTLRLLTMALRQENSDGASCPSGRISIGSRKNTFRFSGFMVGLRGRNLNAQCLRHRYRCIVEGKRLKNNRNRKEETA